jgi:hypothetical protein
MNLSLVLVLPTIDAESVIGVRRINDVAFEPPLQTGDSVPVEVIVGSGSNRSMQTAVEVLAAVSCRCGSALHAAARTDVPGALGSAPAAADLYAEDFECVANIPV